MDESLVAFFLISDAFGDVVSKGVVHIDPHDNNVQHLLLPGHSLSWPHSITHKSLVGVVNSGHIPGLSSAVFCDVTSCA